MSLLFFKRVLANPIQVGYLVPSSGFLTRRTAKRIDFSKPRDVVELGPGEGCHTRQIVRRMDAGSKLILIELDAHFAAHLRKQFLHDPRVTVVQSDALHLATTLGDMGISDPDYIVSGSASCVAMLGQDYLHLFRNDPAWLPRAEAISKKIGTSNTV